jgi:O6-methylguanine-DNA--protein-cysteine methyltransferase
MDAIIGKRLDKEQRKLSRQFELEIENRLLKEQARKPEVDVKGAPAPEDFASSDDYYDARAEWIADKKFEQKLSEREKANSAKQLTEEATRRVTAFIAKHPDYEETIENIKHIQVHQSVLDALKQSEVGADITYYLAKNQNELDKIVGMTPHAAIMALGKIESKLTATEPDKRPVSKAPVPINALDGKAGGITKGHSPEDDYQTFLRKRNVELGRIK